MPDEADRQPRRIVAFQGFGLLDDGTTFALSIRDLSYDGCKIETELALMPGLELRLSVPRLGGTLLATVRWYRDGLAGLRFSNDARAEESQTPRKYDRAPIAAEVSIRRRGRDHYQCRLFDLTADGCKVEFVERPKVGETLWLKFAGLDSIESHVRWVEGFYGGIEFVRPIYPAVFELLLARLAD